MTFTVSHHCHVRRQQRGLRNAELQLLLDHGTLTEEGVVWSRKNTAELNRVWRCNIETARKLEGMFAATTGGVVKTVFKATRKQQRRLLED